jgi:XTP/dITP diphosphohydrolase/tetrapyrrole methylase family protein/MazG family protein/ATP diphosphatase
VGEALLALDTVTRRLRRDCPWDREQSERSIVPHTVEEAYELADAAHSGDDAKLLDELGDVLFQVYFLALLLEERGKGDLAGVARNVTEKLVRRHPHVFGGDDEEALAGLPTEARTPAQVRENWDAIKRTESPAGEHPLSGIPETLPALTYARKLQRRAAGGSDRGDPGVTLASLRASLAQAEEAVREEEPGPEAQENTEHASPLLYERVGDMLFAAVELARSLQVDPELALRRSADRFRARATQAG